jgi:hypothetical protein
MVITVQVTPDDQPSPQPRATNREEEMKQLVQECVDQVMEILREKKER